MAEFVLLFGALALGSASARLGWMPDDSPKVLNAWVIRIALPALVLVEIPKIQLAPELAFAMAGPWIVALGAVAVFIPLGKLLDWSRQRTGAIILTCGLGNTAFMGLPMVEALAGEAAVGTAVIVDQLGSFFALSLVGVVVAASFSGGSLRPRDIVRRIVLFPPFMALVAAFVVGGLGGWPNWVEQPLAVFGATLTPTALFAVGFQLRVGHAWTYRGVIAIGLTWKLLLAPLVVLGTGMMLGLSGQLLHVTVLQCAMAPMITAGILAADSRLEPPLAASMVGVGIALSFASVPLWWAVLA